MRLYDLLDKIVKILNVDHVVERGTQNGWDYVKWSSGYIDAWRAVEYKTGRTTASWGTPAEMANANYSVIVTPGVNGSLASSFWIGDSTGNNDKTNTTFSLSCIRTTDRYSIYFSMIFHGKYKRD